MESDKISVMFNEDMKKVEDMICDKNVVNEEIYKSGMKFYRKWSVIPTVLMLSDKELDLLYELKNVLDEIDKIFRCECFLFINDYLLFLSIDFS